MSARRFVGIVVAVAAVIIGVGLAVPPLRAWLGITVLPLA